MKDKIKLLELYKPHTLRNWPEIEKSKICGCLNCGKAYPAKLVEECFGDKDGNNLTAICTYCHETALIGDASGLELTNEIFNNLHKIYYESK